MVLQSTHRPDGKTLQQLGASPKVFLTAPASRKRRGASAVEFAVVAIIFFPMILGILEIGRGLMVGHLAALAAQRGCRTAVVEGTANTDVATTVESSMSSGGITVTSSNVTVQVNNSTKDCSSASSGDEITVIVFVPVSSVTWVPGGGFLKWNIYAQYTLLRQ